MAAPVTEIRCSRNPPLLIERNISLLGSKIPVTGLYPQATEKSGVRFPAGGRHFLLLHRVQTDTATHAAAFPEFSPQGYARDVRLITLPRLTLCFVIPPLNHCA
jgi:hypothetical protein